MCVCVPGAGVGLFTVGGGGGGEAILVVGGGGRGALEALPSPLPPVIVVT